VFVEVWRQHVNADMEAAGALVGRVKADSMSDGGGAGLGSLVAVSPTPSPSRALLTCKGDHSLHERELVAHTLAGAAAEGDVPAVTVWEGWEWWEWSTTTGVKVAGFQE
jgi:hypothetical protein